MFSKDAARGFGEAARASSDRKIRDALWEYNRLPSKEAKAAFVDKWTRIAIGNMESTWAMLYDSLRIIKEDKLYENAGVMEDHKARATFQEYWQEVVGKPFHTWAELESTHHYVKEHCPELLDKICYDEAKKLVTSGDTERGNPSGSNQYVKVEMSNSDNSTQSDRARENGVGRQTQIKLDKLAAQRPDLLARVQAGELSAHGACIKAGWEVAKVSIPLEPVAAAEVIRSRFKGEALDILRRELSK